MGARAFRSAWAKAAVGLAVLLMTAGLARADVIINVLAVNGADRPVEKDITYSLPGEIVPEDVLDTAGLEIDYNVKDAGYFLHGKVSLAPGETKTFRVRVRDLWRITPDDAAAIRKEIDQGFQGMGAEKSEANGKALRDKLSTKLDYILEEQSRAADSVEQRINAFRNHHQALQEIQTKAKLIDFWRSDPEDLDNNKVVYYVAQVSNPGDKTRKIKQQHMLPPEVRPEYILDLQGYEVRYDEKKQAPFLFREEDLGPGEKRDVRFPIRDVWFIPAKETAYVRSRADGIFETLQHSKFLDTAKTLYAGIINSLDLIAALQAEQQPDIKQHIGAYRINARRFEQAKKDLDALEKLLARFRADLEKSKIKNVMQKIQSLQSLARVSQAIFDKKPRVNAAWKIIGSVMLFLALFTLIHFVTWFIRSGREKKMAVIEPPKDTKEQA